MRVFSGGIHLHNYFKDITKDKQISDMPVPSKVVIPLSQHTGQPSVPVINKGDMVLKGQKIGEAGGKISVPVHSSISGKVIDICPWEHPVISQKVLSIVIENDGEDKPVNLTEKFDDYKLTSPDEIREVIRDAGIVGLGGAAFPAHVKLSPPVSIDTVIINGCECEPFLTSDDRLLQERPEDVIEGARIVMHVLKVKKGIIAIEDNKEIAIKTIQKVLKDISELELKVVKTKYPQGGEKQLIKTVLDREVPPGKLPFDVGVVVHNVGTCVAIADAVLRGIPLISRVVTVTGKNLKKPGNYKVRIGTLFEDLLNYCEINSDGDFKIISGGPMMGISQGSLQVPVIKGTSGILVLPVDKKSQESGSCIRCGKCLDVCPMKLMPNMLSLYSENEMWDKTIEYFPGDCIECGCCSYICPAKRPIVQHIKVAKLNIKR